MLIVSFPSSFGVYLALLLVGEAEVKTELTRLAGGSRRIRDGACNL